MKTGAQQCLPRVWLFTRIFLSPVLGLAIVVLLCRSVAWSIGTQPALGLTTEAVVVQHQQAAAVKLSSADLLFIGDSTCLMNLDLSTIPSRFHSLNLGTLSILPLPSFADLVAQFTQTNAGEPPCIVLLISPAMIEQESSRSRASAPEAPLERSGLLVLRNWVQHLVPVPLPGKYGPFYGFNQGLERYMQKHRGSAVDPGTLGISTKRSSVIRIGASFREQCREFRRRLPPHKQLLVGLAPISREQVGSAFGPQHYALTCQLNDLVGGDHPLALPAIYPALFFASITHLKQEVRPAYTRTVWQAIESVLEAPAEKATNAISMAKAAPRHEP